MRSTTIVLGAAALLSACGDVKSNADDRDVVCGAQPVEVLPNGSFDDATPAWTQNPSTPKLLCGSGSITPADGTMAACMGGMDGVVQTLSQAIQLPAGVKTLTLTGQFCATTEETAAADNDTLVFEVLDGATPIATLGMRTNQQGAMSCSFGAFTLTAPVSADPVDATFRITSTLNTLNTTSWFIDKLSLTADCN